MRMLIVVCMLALAAPILADAVQVEITGEVEFNQVSTGPFAAVVAGDAVSVMFALDSNDYLDSPSFPTRGYVIDVASFTATYGSVAVGLQDPFPGGTVPYFVLRDNDPAVDGFFLSTGTDFPAALPLDVEGNLGPFGQNFSVGYDGDTLTSLDILDAVGTYDYTGLTNFYFTVGDGPFDAIGLIFGQLTISGGVRTEAASWGSVKALFR